MLHHKSPSGSSFHEPGGLASGGPCLAHLRLFICQELILLPLADQAQESSHGGQEEPDDPGICLCIITGLRQALLRLLALLSLLTSGTSSRFVTSHWFIRR